MTGPEERQVPQLDSDEQTEELEQALDDAAIGDEPNQFDDPQAAARKESGEADEAGEDDQAPTPPG